MDAKRRLHPASMKPTSSPSRLERRRQRPVFNRQRRPKAWQEVLVGLACLGLGFGLLAGLQQLLARLDAVLLLSEALNHLLGGLTNLGLGLGQILAGLLVLLTIAAALLLLLAGMIRLLRPWLPAPVAPPPSRPAAGEGERPLNKRRRPRRGLRRP